MRTGRFLRPVMVASLGLAILVPLGASAVDPSGSDIAGCEIKGQVSIRDDHWARISSPGYEAEDGENVITAFDAPPKQRGWLYVTNGNVLKLSIDGGCRWNHIYSADDAASASPGSVAPVFTHVVAPAARSLWLATYDEAADGTGRPRVYRTEDATPTAGNQTTVQIEPIEVGLPAVGKPISLIASPDGELSKTVAYVLIEHQPGGERRLYRTKIDNETGIYNEVEQYPRITWQEVLTPEGFGPIDGITMAPGGWGVWIWSGDKYAATPGTAVQTQTPAGPSPAEPPAPATVVWQTGTAPGEIATIDINTKSLAALFVNSGEGTQIQFVKAPGEALGTMGLPFATKAAAHGNRTNVYAAAGDKATYGYDTRVGRWVDITPKGVEPFSQLEIVRGGENGSILVGKTDEAIYRFDLYPQETFLPPPPPPPGTGDPNAINVPVSDLEDAVMTPVSHVVTVAPGQMADVPVSLGVPPSPSPLDVFFIVDTTFSMAAVIKSLQEGVKKLAVGIEKALDKATPAEKAKRKPGQCPVAFGIGDVKDFGIYSVDKAFQVHQKVTCDLERVKRGADLLKEGGGDANQFEGQTLALKTAVTGEPSTRPPLPAGLDAGFRLDQNPYKVIVLITDAGFMQGGEWPTIDDAVATLNDRQVKVVGVVAVTENDYEAAKADVEEVAAGTDTLAPRSGVDCDGDGKRDVQAGRPLVCDVDGGSAPNLVPAIANLLLGVTEPGKLGVDMVDPHKVVDHTIGLTSDLFNFKLESTLKFTTVVTCRPDQDGKDLPVTLIGRRKGEAIKKGRILVRCRSLPVPPPPPVIEPFFPEEPPAPRPVMAPVPVPEVPIPVPNNPISNVNPNAGLSHEEQKQFQIAGVTQGAGEEEEVEEETELAMSTLDPSSAAAQPFALGGAMMLSVGAAAVVGYRRRSQGAVRPSYVRTRR